MFKLTEKSWLSPFLMITYLATAVTGIFMLFHIRFPGLYPIHKWGGLVFVIAAILHLVINWKLFCSYFSQDNKRRCALVGIALGVSIVLLIAILIPSGNRGGRGHHSSYEPSNSAGSHLILRSSDSKFNLP